MQESRLILLQAVASRESGRSTCRLRSSRPVHCVHHLQIHAPSLHLPAVCCKPLQSPCNSPAVYALPLDVVTDAPVAAFGCAEPSSTGVVRCLRRCSAPPSSLDQPIPCYRNRREEQRSIIICSKTSTGHSYLTYRPCVHLYVRKVSCKRG